MHAATSRKIAGLSADQWGMFTAAQANQAGLSPVALSRLVSVGSLERVRWGVYQVPGTPASRLSEHKAAWLSLNPSTPAWIRLQEPEKDFVFAGFSATWILDVSDQIPKKFDFLTSRNAQRRASDVGMRRQSTLSRDQVQIIDGLPILAPNALIEDLATSSIDVDDLFAVVDEIGVQSFKIPRLIDSLTLATKRYGWEAEGVKQKLLDTLDESLKALETYRNGVSQNRDSMEKGTPKSPNSSSGDGGI